MLRGAATLACLPLVRLCGPIHDVPDIEAWLAYCRAKRSARDGPPSVARLAAVMDRADQLSGSSASPAPSAHRPKPTRLSRGCRESGRSLTLGGTRPRSTSGDASRPSTAWARATARRVDGRRNPARKVWSGVRLPDKSDVLCADARTRYETPGGSRAIWRQVALSGDKVALSGVRACDRGGGPLPMGSTLARPQGLRD